MRTATMRSSRRGWLQNWQTQPMAQQRARTHLASMPRSTSIKRRRSTRSTKKTASTRLRRSGGLERRRNVQRKTGRENLGMALIHCPCFLRNSLQTPEDLLPHKRARGVSQNAESRTLPSVVPPTLQSEKLILLHLKPLHKQIVMMILETYQQ